MRHLIALALLWALRLVLPARGQHRRRPLAVICGPTEPVQLTMPKRVICAPTRPIPVLDLRETAQHQPSDLVPRYLVAFERMSPADRAAVTSRQAALSAKRWARVEQWAQQQETAAQRTRRAAAFAAQLDLPDPLHWLDSIVTGVPHTLAGAVA